MHRQDKTRRDEQNIDKAYFILPYLGQTLVCASHVFRNPSLTRGAATVAFAIQHPGPTIECGWSNRTRH